MTDRKINLAAIEEAAGKAPPSPWVYQPGGGFGDCVFSQNSTIGPDGRYIDDAVCLGGKNQRVGLAHIALNDPATTLAFVEAVRAMKQARETLSIAMDTEPNEWTHVDRDELRRVHGIVCDALQPFVDGEVG